VSDGGASGSSGFPLVCGPCVLEDDGLNLRVADEIRRTAADFGMTPVFKASFDKANRSKRRAHRGPGLRSGLEKLAMVRGETGLSICTDIHEPHQAEAVAGVVDVIQIPAFLCRQTDLLVAAGRTGLAVNIKKGQWMAPEEMAGAVDKVRGAGASSVFVTERGTAFGYGDLIVDMRSFERLRAATGATVLFDGTHAVQRPGRLDGASGGDPRHTPALVRAAVAAGCDGLFLEVQPEPARAPADGSTMLPLDHLGPLLAEVSAVRAGLAPLARSRP